LPGKVPSPTIIIHMSHMRNLSKIVASGGLVSVGRLKNAGSAYTDIAYGSIQAQRAAKGVPCGPGGVLHDYVPFYFAPKSPMLFTINKGNVPCDGGQANIVHLVTTAQSVAASGHAFAFTDGHGIMGYTQYFDDLANLGQVDWDIMKERYWSDTDADGDRKRRRQAEFLVHNGLPLKLISHIVVKTPGKAAEVDKILLAGPSKPTVVVKPDWYY
jgi:hypothetical protein